MSAIGKVGVSSNEVINFLTHTLTDCFFIMVEKAGSRVHLQHFAHQMLSFANSADNPKDTEKALIVISISLFRGGFV